MKKQQKRQQVLKRYLWQLFNPHHHQEGGDLPGKGGNNCKHEDEDEDCSDDDVDNDNELDDDNDDVDQNTLQVWMHKPLHVESQQLVAKVNFYFSPRLQTIRL